MKKIVSLVAAVLCIATLLVGCNGSSTFGYVFEIDNGDKIGVKVDISGGYSVTSDVPFAISVNGETQTYGQFIYADVYAEYVAAIEEDADATLLESGEKDGLEYVMWKYNDEEFNYVVLITENTAVVLGNNISEESARECFARLILSDEG